MVSTMTMLVVSFTILTILCAATPGTTEEDLATAMQQLQNDMQSVLSTLHSAISYIKDLEQNSTLCKISDVAKLQARIEQLETCLKCSKDEETTTIGPSFGSNTTKLPKDCEEALYQGSTISGVYTISPDNITKINVYCEQQLDGGGWTVFQRRQDGSVDFYRTWADYKAGFGNPSGEFWLGNDNLHLLTQGHDQRLKVELTYYNEIEYADYSTFWVDAENLKYRLSVSGYTGGSPPADSLTRNHHHGFSTKDQDNDAYSGHCAQRFVGGWWYDACHEANLNGLYGSTLYGKGLNWRYWKGYYVSMTGTRMMIKEKP